MSEEHKARGYRPPPGSLAAKAQRAAAAHPETKGHIDPATLADAAIKDAGAEAPVAAGVLLVGVLDKVATFGFLRYCLPLFPVRRGACICRSCTMHV